MDGETELTNDGQSQVKYIVDANQALSSNQGSIDMFEDQVVAAYDTCIAEDASSYIEVNVIDDDDDMNLYSDVESELAKAVENQDNMAEEKTSEEQSGTCDREEGELTSEPDITRETPEGVCQTESGPDVNKVLQEFNKRLAEIQAEAKRQSLELQKTLAEKLKMDVSALKEDASNLPVEEEQTTIKKPVDDEEQESKPRAGSRNRSTDGSEHRRDRSADDGKTQRRRQRDEHCSPEKKADEEMCVDCIAEKLERARRGRRGCSDEGDHRQSRLDRGRSRDRRRSSRDWSRDRRRSSRNRNRDRRKSTRDDSRRESDRKRESRSVDRHVEDSRHRIYSGRDDDYLRPSRRDLLTKATNSGDERTEKRRMKTLVKRQMQIISDVIDNPNPKSVLTGTIALSHKESFETKDKKAKCREYDNDGSQRSAPDAGSNDLSAMERFLEQLRDVSRKKSVHSGEAERRHKQLKILKSAGTTTYSGGSPAQSRISIRKPLDDNEAYFGGSNRKLYFSSGSRRRVLKSPEKENVPGNESRNKKPRPEEKQEQPGTETVVKGDANPSEKLEEISSHREDKGSHSKIKPADDFPDTPIKDKIDITKSKTHRRNSSNDSHVYSKSFKRPSGKREHRRDSNISDEEEIEDVRTSKNKKPQARERKKSGTSDLPSASESDEHPKRRSSEYTRNAALCKKRAIKKKKMAGKMKETPSSSSEPGSDLAVAVIGKKKKKRKSVSSLSELEQEPKQSRRTRKRHQTPSSESDVEYVELKKKGKRRDPISTHESDQEKERKYSRRPRRRNVVHSESEHEEEEVVPKMKTKKDLSDGSDSDSYEILKKNLISMCRRNGLDMDLLQLFLGGVDSDQDEYDEVERPKTSKRKQPRKNASKTKMLGKKSQTREGISTPEPRKRCRPEEEDAEETDLGPTLEELETFLSHLRGNRKEVPEEDFLPGLEMQQSIRKESAFLDRHRAKRKAKLMACVALTAKASAKEARVLEALQKAKDEHEIEKEKMIRKLKAGNDAIFSFSGEKKPKKEEPRVKLGMDLEDSRKMFGISFAFKSPLKKTHLSAADQPIINADILSSEKAQALLNSLRAKKKVKKCSQESKDLPEKVNSA